MQTFTDGILKETDLKVNIADAIKQNVGEKKYKIWFDNSTRLSVTEQYVNIGVPNIFVANWIEKNFASQIEKAVKQATGKNYKISFAIDKQLAEQQRKTKNENKTLLQIENGKKFSKSSAKVKNINTRFTLDNFVVGSSNQLAYTAALAVVNEDKSPFNPLFIHGGYGLGKTHLLQGICNALRSNLSRTNWQYLSAEDFVNQFVLALKTKKLEAFRRRFRQTDLLAIDDIHFLASKPSSQEEFLHTFNTIDLAGKQIILASDAHPRYITQLSEKLVNRFISGMVVKIENPDFQTRCKICRQFAESKETHLPEPVVRLIAETLRSNIRELEGAVIKVIAYSSLQNQKISLQTAKEILSEHISRTDPIVHVSDIESAVSNFFGVTPSDLHSVKKDRTIALARHFSMYLARKHTNMSSPEIGKCMGKKNHATVLLACRQIEKYLSMNSELNWRGSNGNKILKAKKILVHLENSIAG